MSDRENDRFKRPSECLSSSECNMTSYRNSFKVNSFKIIQIPDQALKKINCTFDKISLLLQTVLESEAASFLPNV